MNNITLIPYEERVVHVRFEGQSWKLALVLLNLTEQSTEQDVRTALARHFEVTVQRFESYVIEQHPNGNLTIRPEAVFG